MDSPRTPRPIRLYRDLTDNHGLQPRAAWGWAMLVHRAMLRHESQAFLSHEVTT